VDGVGNETESVSRTFTVDAAPPAAFALAGPQDDAATTDRRPALSWQATSDDGIGLVGYDVLLDGEVVASVDASTTIFTSTTDLAEGMHDWQVMARDANGNLRASEMRRFSVDATPPVARLTAAPNPALVGRVVALDGGGSSDATTGIVRFQWDLDGDGTFERDTGATATTSQTFADPGTFAIQLRVTDRAGLSATVRVEQRISAETRGSGQPGISINDGARFTNDPKVTIKATWPSFASQMLISNDGGFKTAQTSALQTDTPWTLDSSGAERLPKTVYVRFVRGLTVSETYTDDIILDERAPLVTSAQVSAPASTDAPLLALRARDRGPSGVASVQVSNNRQRPHARFRRYRATVKLTSLKGERLLHADKPIYVRVRDGAGNLSAWRAARRSFKRTGSTSRG
jgi:PKD repeat protein